MAHSMHQTRKIDIQPRPTERCRHERVQGDLDHGATACLCCERHADPSRCSARNGLTPHKAPVLADVQRIATRFSWGNPASRGEQAERATFPGSKAHASGGGRAIDGGQAPRIELERQLAEVCEMAITMVGNRGWGGRWSQAPVGDDAATGSVINSPASTHVVSAASTSTPTPVASRMKAARAGTAAEPGERSSHPAASTARALQTGRI